MNCLAPSILAADFGNLEHALVSLDRAGAQYVHLDIMDGQFVPNISLGLPVIESLRGVTDRIFDVHLMVNEPIRYVEAYAKAGADIITVHAEACTHLDRTISMIHEQKVLAGVALNPATSLSAIEYLLPGLDMVLLMSVNPGFGGQEFIPYTIDKLQDLSQMIQKKGCSLDVEVDGGITLKNVREVMQAGANIIVSGSAVFNGNIEENVRAFLELM